MQARRRGNTLAYMSLNRATSVRFDSDTLARLQAVSSESGIGLTKLVRIATARLLDEVEAKGELKIPCCRVAEKRAEYTTRRDME